jgi:hypothetical protein
MGGGLAQRRRGGEVRELEERGETIGRSIVMAPPFSLECAQSGRDFGILMIGLPAVPLGYDERGSPASCA